MKLIIIKSKTIKELKRHVKELRTFYKFLIYYITNNVI